MGRFSARYVSEVMELIDKWALSRSVDEVATFAGLVAAEEWYLAFADAEWSSDQFALASARLILSCFVLGVYPNDESSVVADRAAAFLENVRLDAGIGRRNPKDASIAGSAAATNAIWFAGFATHETSDPLEISGNADGCAELIEQHGPQDVFDVPLRSGSNGPEFRKVLEAGSTRRSNRSVWGFWIDWYEGLLAGRTPDWDLWHDIVLIPNDVWEAGPEAVARAIDAIMSKRGSPDIPPETIAAQAKALIAKPTTTGLITAQVADQIDDAITQYMRAANTNTIPEAFERLRGIPPLLRGIGQNSQSAERISELEQQVSDLVAETIGLARDFEDLRADLAAKKPSDAYKIFVEQCAKTSATILTTTFWGSVAMGLSHTIGLIDFGSALETLSDFGKEADDIINALPKAVDT